MAQAGWMDEMALGGEMGCGVGTIYAIEVCDRVNAWGTMVFAGSSRDAGEARVEM